MHFIPLPEARWRSPPHDARNTPIARDAHGERAASSPLGEAAPVNPRRELPPSVTLGVVMNQ